MAGQGPPPGTGKKPAGQRRRRNKEEPHTELDATAKVPAAPELPAGEWSDTTRAWWSTWAQSPQATLFTGPAWKRLEMTARLVEDFNDPATSATLRKQLLTEIRLNESTMLAMPADQLRAKLDLRPPTDTGKAPASKSGAKRNADRKDRILKAVPDAAAG